eukprot:TRINITY_DN21574_c0_g1_i1.p1 TRINITY_DN21574_c0_g1~~TRINITY_DN21574_c0_g1_i1.p1  ORF type:complete len:552 (+),score=167.01 TRINITY_DN21574_c0_g1_i1:99-1754(+)
MSRLGLLVCVSILGSLGTVFASEDVVMYESFSEHWEGRWIPSEQDGYGGLFKHEKSDGHDDFGLLVSEPAKKYGIAWELPEVVDALALKDKPLVLQYELRLQKGLECGGAYLKFLAPQEQGWSPASLKDSTPYSIMFGPDKCGSTNKVHFIFRHKHPKTGEYIEHHLQAPPLPVNDKLTHVYTAVIYPNNTLKILIDGEEKKVADLLGLDFTPPVLPPKTIPDPEDKKPEDWDERPKIADPEASKPEDWDEDAPREIEDADAVKPEGWLDDEPDEVDDPEAAKPSDWDDEEDGEWEPPKIANPKCEEGPGCGEWKRPKKANPAYKGKWSAPLIENPAYKGIWKPREIPNPDYFELERPRIEPVAGVALEIWTMQDGMLFDDIIVATDESVAEEIRNTEWKPKSEKEAAAKEAEDEEEKKAASSKDLKEKLFDQMYKIADIPFLKDYKQQITDVVELLEKEYPMTFVSVLAGFVGLLVAGFIYMLLPGKPAPKVSIEVAKKEDVTEPDDEEEKAEEVGEEDTQEGTVEEEEEADEADTDKGRPKRRTRQRDT